MAQNPTSRRKLATPDPEPISKHTVKRHLNPSTTATSTVYNLTNHFSKLNPNPNPNPQTVKTQKYPPPSKLDTHMQAKALSKSASFEPSNTTFGQKVVQTVKSQKYPPPSKLIDTHLQAKALSKSATFEPSNTTFGQKVVKQGKRVVLESVKEVKRVVERDGTRTEDEESSKNEVVGMKVVRPKEMVVSGIGKRRSLSDAQVELGNFLITNCAKVVCADMPPFIQIHAIGFARKTKDSLEKFTSKNLALSLKKEFDGVYGPAWHCIVGTSFGSFVTHSVGGFLYFSLDQKLYVLLFKTTVQKAD